MQDNGLQHPTYILQNTDAPHSGGWNGPSWPEAWDQVSMVALTLKGHEKHLFKRHISFKEGRRYMDAPHMSPSFQSLIFSIRPSLPPVGNIGGLPSLKACAI